MLLCAGAGVALAGTTHLTSELINDQALQSAQVSVKIMNEARVLYSKTVVNRISDLPEITVGPDYHAVFGGIPNPATYAIELGEKLSSQEKGTLFRLYSDYPFPNRQATGGPHDQFQKDALAYLKQHPTEAFYRQEKQGNHRLFRYAEAVSMEPTCVTCHNHLLYSPKRNWQVGDVRGVLEVSQSIDPLLNTAQIGVKAISASLLIIGGLGVVGTVLIFSYSRSVNQILREEVQIKTAALQQLATIDELTQISNRRQFDQTLENQWRAAQTIAKPLSLLLCDVDFFKKYNDAYGHQIGDRCLRLVAGAIQASLRNPCDLAARYGGEEFAVILPQADVTEAKKTADQIMAAVQQLKIEHQQSEISPYVSLSIGVATLLPTASNQPADLIRLADRALYQAKAQGRQRVVACSEE
jgi:diguanylate cyclase (GGDEF)-like protein